MAKDPAFLFYTGDFSTGTQFFSDEQLGKYVRLLMAQHQTGHLEEKHMMHICKTHDKDIFSKFLKDAEGKYYNQRLDNEIIKRQKYAESRRSNRSKKTDTSVSYDSHMENENKNENKDITKKSEGKKNGKKLRSFKSQGQDLYAEKLEEPDAEIE